MGITFVSTDSGGLYPAPPGSGLSPSDCKVRVRTSALGRLPHHLDHNTLVSHFDDDILQGTDGGMSPQWLVRVGFGGAGPHLAHSPAVHTTRKSLFDPADRNDW